MPNAVVYRDELPEGCPPAEAEGIDMERIVFHFVRRRAGDLERPLSSGEFQSQRTRRPTAVFAGADECIARGLSVFGSSRVAASVLERARTRGRWVDMRICRVTLNDGDGAILKTSRGRPTTEGQHWTWWPAGRFEFANEAKAQLLRGEV